MDKKERKELKRNWQEDYGGSGKALEALLDRFTSLITDLYKKDMCPSCLSPLRPDSPMSEGNEVKWCSKCGRRWVNSDPRPLP